MKTKALLAASVAAALLAAAPSAMAQTKLQLSTGLDYSSGKFGTNSRTDVLVVPLAARVTTGNWAFRASLPVVTVRGDATTIGSQVFVVVDDNGGLRSGSSGGGGGGRDHPEDDGSVTTGTTTTTTTKRVTNTGLSDLSLSATYTFDELLGADTYLDVAGRVRLPTGNEKKGLSLGVTDYAATAEVGLDRDGGGVYLNAGRRFLEDATAFKREDGWQAGVGGWIEVTDDTVVGAFADWRESSSRAGEDPAEAGAYVTHRLTPSLKIGVNASAGLTDASPDFGVGLTLSWRANERGDR